MGGTAIEIAGAGPAGLAAMTSGVLAACSLLEGSDYDRKWQQELGELMATAAVNRALYSLLDNRGYRWLLRHQENRSDARELLHRYYRPSRVKRLLVPLARRRFESQRKDASCDHVDCSCVWCRHGRELHA